MQLGAFSVSVAVKDIAAFTGVRGLQRRLKEQGIALVPEAYPSTRRADR